MPYWNKQVIGAMNDIRVAIYLADPMVRSQVITKNQSNGENGQKALDHFSEIVIRGVKDQVTRLVFRRHFCGESATQASAVNNYVVFRILLYQPGINKLHIAEHLLFTSFPGTFSKTPVINKHHVIIVAVKILCVFGPPFYAPAVPMKVEN